jgi:hypothetical protein
MKIRNMIAVSALLALPTGLWAQKWEVGGMGGGSFYTSRDVTVGSATAEAKFEPGYAAGFYVGQDMGRYWGGDIRYTFQSNSAQLSGSGGKASFGAQSHTIHYDFLLHFAPPGSKARPYLAFGAGVKQYRGTGTEVVVQPLSEFALLTKANELTPVATFAVGVKFQIGANARLRIEMRDYLSPVPTKVIQPNRGADLSGWIHNFAPMVGISYIF